MAYILSCNKKKMTGLVLLKVLPKLLEAKFMLVNLAISSHKSLVVRGI